MTDKSDNKFLWRMGFAVGSIAVIFVAFLLPILIEYLFIAALMWALFWCFGWEFSIIYPAGILILAHLIRFIHKVIIE